MLFLVGSIECNRVFSLFWLFCVYLSGDWWCLSIEATVKYILFNLHTCSELAPTYTLVHLHHLHSITFATTCI